MLTGIASLNELFINRFMIIVGFAMLDQPRLSILQLSMATQVVHSCEVCMQQTSLLWRSFHRQGSIRMLKNLVLRLASCHSSLSEVCRTCINCEPVTCVLALVLGTHNLTCFLLLFQSSTIISIVRLYY